MPDKTRQADAPSSPRGKTDWAALDAMTGDEAEAAALADPDAPPLREGQTMHPMAGAKRIRFRLRLSQEDFVNRFHIPLATLTAWERHELIPDAVAIAFLDAIAADPEGLAKALAKSSKKPEAAE